MKKIVLAFCAMLVMGCSTEYERKSAEKNVKEQITVLDIGENIETMYNRVTKFEFDGHWYIAFKRQYGQYSTEGIVHDPDCVCKIDYD